MTEYIRCRRERLARKEIRDLSLFGQLGGLILFVLALFKYFTAFQTWQVCIVFLVGVLGMYLSLGGFFFPKSIKWLYRGFSYVGDKIGQIIFCVLLTILYFCLVTPISIIMKRNKESYLLSEWQGEYSGLERWGFTKWSQVKVTERKGFLGAVLKVMGTFAGNGQYILIPSVLILVILGIILFFVSSSVLAPFIYTLF